MQKRPQAVRLTITAMLLWPLTPATAEDGRAPVLLRTQTLTEKNYDDLVPHGKEADAIYGDSALINSRAKAVIARPVSTRNANMTVKTIAGCLIDFATTDFESDQLSAFFPGRRKFPFTVIDTHTDHVIVTAKGTSDRPKCEVHYQLLSDLPVMEITSLWTNTTSRQLTLSLEDDIRADANREDMVKSENGVHDLFYVHDIHWQQSYGVRAQGFLIRCNSNARESVLTYERSDEQPVVIEPGGTYSLVRQIMVGRDLPEVLAINDELQGRGTPEAAKIQMMDAQRQAIPGARVTFRSEAGERGTTVTDKEGFIRPRLPLGDYRFDITAAGVEVFKPDIMRFVVHRGTTESIFRFGGYSTGRVIAAIQDDKGQSIPAKVTFAGVDETPTPNWGPESGEHFVRNAAYTENGKFETQLVAGQYEVIVSRGPEYDAVFTTVTVDAGKNAELNVTLKHSVTTTGWVSGDFHSHSSPSGDNTGSQRGRVLNLAAEHIEFAPCTEHNRISSYVPHITELGLQPFLATVTGMELTGLPLPLNHQNVFPLKHFPRTQDGGGPLTDVSPEAQIERLSVWDERGEKLIQQDHPDVGWFFFDKDGDGTPDGGYARSFPLIDVMEIHPIDRILDVQQFDFRDGKKFGNNRMLNWLQLLNQGFRIYGVVNTDAHYNFHESGFVRNWIQSSTDDPAKIEPMEMVRASREGRLIMSNGPYLQSVFEAVKRGELVSCGQDLMAKDGKVDVHVRVQCANWLDIDTVSLLINGRRAEDFHFTRKSHPELFTDGTVRFDKILHVTLKEDSHLVVVTGHQSEMLGDVYGPIWGQQHPAALTNPVFVDVDGDGFQPNKDTLGFPLPVKFKGE